MIDAINNISILKNNNSESDPIISQLSQRAHDLSLSIINPKTLSTKLRESLLSIAGDKSKLYHIGINFDGKVAEVKIAALTPSFVSQINLLSSNVMQLGFAYRKTMNNGWNIQVGVMAEYKADDDKMDIPSQSNLMAQFSVTISK